MITLQSIETDELSEAPKLISSKTKGERLLSCSSDRLQKISKRTYYYFSTPSDGHATQAAHTVVFYAPVLCIHRRGVGAQGPLLSVFFSFSLFFGSQSSKCETSAAFAPSFFECTSAWQRFRSNVTHGLWLRSRLTIHGRRETLGEEARATQQPSRPGAPSRMHHRVRSAGPPLAASHLLSAPPPRLQDYKIKGIQLVLLSRFLSVFWTRFDCLNLLNRYPPTHCICGTSPLFYI